jgi:hypothetical protein
MEGGKPEVAAPAFSSLAGFPLVPGNAAFRPPGRTFCACRSNTRTGRDVAFTGRVLHGQASSSKNTTEGYAAASDPPSSAIPRGLRDARDVLARCLQVPESPSLTRFLGPLFDSAPNNLSASRA